MKEELASLREFRTAHRAALDRLRKRERGVVFPAGTYRVKLFGVRCRVPERPSLTAVPKVPDGGSASVPRVALPQG
jgi:hypothetical protein